ncbi:hypothetical protein TspCOW1_01510 [Thiohalobacter sp. COW1]|uniref:VPLPA-CTERM sorting domain-containing protein n=1 Tax=Thiohalobacter sp. COW1 TaxID=2795687 RepID=UPI0019151AC6|nr:VPLPA-CTERM sorting domain-containing protein [Thiohalobacter sp. COW1]BCO30048.1 hypothetical protein TspCOW1_01510 [Thiohalobacter sp. COW1]
MFKLKATVVAVALAASGAAQAIAIDETDIVVNIVRNGLSGDSMVINTDVKAEDIFSGAVSSFSSDTALSTAIFDFIDGASDVRYWVVGRFTSGFDKFMLSNFSVTDQTAVGPAVDSNIPAYITGANTDWFNAAPDNYVTDIPDGDRSHFGETNVYGNGLVNGVSLGDSYDFLYSQVGFFAGTKNGQLGSWNLATNGTLSYDAVSAVPVPAAVWLFGSGLIGLVGIARRRKQA